MMRDSSPPEAMRASGRSSSPGFGETRNSAVSIPRDVHADSGGWFSLKRTSKRVRFMASSASVASSALANCVAAFRRRADNTLAASR